MKTNHFLMGAMALCLMMSCKKNASTPSTDTGLTQTIEATVAKNSSYSYTLPSTGATYAIATQSTHAASSAIVASTGSNLYTYVTQAGFIGLDTVVLVAVDTNCMHGDSTHMPPPPMDSAHAGCHHPHGPRPGARLIFHINVKDNSAAQ